MTLIPAYGRDYTSGKAAQADFDAGKDFIVSDLHSPWDGRPVNKEQLTTERTVNIRFNKLRKVVVVKLA